ncbi:MAG: glycosyltransferase family 4 protein [Thermodesulfobacteriota bacterium]
MPNAAPERVFYVGSPELFSRGASAIHIMKMCQAMARLGVKTTLLIPTDRTHGEMFQYYGVESKFRIVPFPYFGNSSARNITHGVLASVYAGRKRKEFDLAVTRNIVFASLAANVIRAPFVYDAHHPLVTGARVLFNSFKRSNHLVRFTTNSRGLGEIYLREGLPPEKLVVAHNGVDLEGYRSLPEKSRARADLGLPEGRKIVCYSGNIYEGRGIEYLIDIAPGMSDALFLIVGGLEKDVVRCRTLAREKNAANIKFTSYVSHDMVPLYLAASDLLVMPYTSHMTIRGGTYAQDFTSPIKLFEYMASGRPIVATSIPSVSEVLEDGVNAVLVPPDSAEALEAGIKRALADPPLSARLAERASYDVRGYTWEERAKKLLGLE